MRGYEKKTKDETGWGERDKWAAADQKRQRLSKTLSVARSISPRHKKG
jgi:hypothetical protein